MSVDVDKI
jgi:hypothetical protein